MRTPNILLFFFLFSVHLFAQEKNNSLIVPAAKIGEESAMDNKNKSGEGGQFSLGMRNTISAFGASGYNGLGYGGQFRIRFAKKLNTEWYADWITTDLGGLGKREDGHIGWSVMFYPLSQSPEKGKFSPYLLAGHCFDYTKVSTNWTSFLPDSKHRLSTAVQMGLGANYMLGEKTDVSLSAQYMSHLGNEIETEKKTSEISGEKYLVINQEKSTLGLEGHLLITLSINFIIADLKK